MRRPVRGSCDAELGVLLAGGRFRTLGVGIPVDLHTGVAEVTCGASCVLPEGSIVTMRKPNELWEPVGVVGVHPVRLPGAAGIWVHPDGALTSAAGRELDSPTLRAAWVRFVCACVTTITRELRMA